MKKICLILAFIAISFIGANAQAPDGFQAGGGVRLSLPVGDWADYWSFGIGAELQGEYGFSEKFSGVFTTGYSSFLGKTIGGIKLDAIGYIPLLAGVRVYPAASFFVGGQLGYGILTGGGSSEGVFNYQPQIGYNGGSFQIALCYNALSESGSTTSHIGLSAIYKFGGNKGGDK